MPTMSRNVRNAKRRVDRILAKPVARAIRPRSKPVEFTLPEVKKVYTFGKYRDAEVRTHYGTKRCTVTRFDPVGQNEPVVQWCDSYSEAAGIAHLHKQMMYVKYGA